MPKNGKSDEMPNFCTFKEGIYKTKYIKLIRIEKSDFNPI